MRRGAVIEPDERQLAELADMASDPDGGPVVMLNLNRYRDREVYGRYGEVALPVLARLGARILWHAPARLTVIGGEADRFDEVIAVWYPSVSAFMTFATDPEIVAAMEHRRAGLERAALICCEAGAEPGVV
jgi:uncharacterized protein (DUF1330 family)